MKPFSRSRAASRLLPRMALSLAMACLAVAPAAVAQQAEAPAAAVTVVKPVQRQMTARIAISGTTVARQEVLVYPQVAGFPITDLPADIGDVVAKGDLLARLDSRQLDAQLAQAKAEASRAEAQLRQAQSQIDAAQAAQSQAQAELERQQGLRDRGTISQAQLEQATSAARQAEAELASARDGLVVAQAAVELAKSQEQVAQLNVDYSSIEAPVDGVISERNGEVGAIAATGGEPLFRIVRDGDIELSAEVLETDLGRIDKGQPVAMQVAGIGPIDGEVRLVSPRVDPDSRLGTIRIQMDGQGLRTGLFASGRITTDQRDTLALPTTAILSDEEGDYVLAVGPDDVLERRDITAGIIEGTYREVAEGIGPDDTVVARAGAFFRPGDKVRPVEPEQQTAGGGQP